jgi:4-amino-4-deoxy-L-arabinose transferase-like glycosyltransferase
LRSIEPSTPACDSLPPKGGLLLLGLLLFLLLLRLGALPLVGPDEPRYVRVAVEMHRAGDLVLPTLGGKPWLEKPPLYYWLAGVFFSFLGETELASRLPSVLSTLLVALSTAILGARFYGRTAGLHAGFVLATSLLAFAYGHAAAMDALLAACATASIGLFALGIFEIAGGLAIPAAWAFAGLAALAKGPLGILLPLLVLGLYGLLARDRRVLKAFSLPGLVLILAIAGPWYVLILRREGSEFVQTFLLGHNVQRFLTTEHHHPGSVLYYVGVLLLGLFPWTPLLLPGLARVRLRTSRVDLFVFLWFLAPFLFFTAAQSKLPGYILPCLPPLALLAGREAARIATDGRGIAPRIGALLGVALGALLACAPLFVRRLGDPGWPTLVPFGVWALLVALVYSRRLGPDPVGAVSVLRVGGAGLLLLLALLAPEILERNESGRMLFAPSRGRRVLALGAWRTAWIAGYFYDDGKVEEVQGPGDVLKAVAAGPTLVVVGAEERRLLERLPSLSCVALSQGPRGTALLRVTAR